MINIEKDLDKLYKQAHSALAPFTAMIGRRKFSPSQLKECADNLEIVVNDIRKFLE